MHKCVNVLLTYNNATDFSICHRTLWNSFISCNNLLKHQQSQVHIVFSINNILFLTIRDIWTFSFLVWILFVSFYCWIIWVGSSIKIVFILLHAIRWLLACVVECMCVCMCACVCVCCIALGIVSLLYMQLVPVHVETTLVSFITWVCNCYIVSDLCSSETIVNGGGDMLRAYNCYLDELSSAWICAQRDTEGQSFWW